MHSKDLSVLRIMQKRTASILEYCSGYRSREEFERNSMCVEATVFNLMQIGELAKASLSEQVKESITTIPWRQIYGLRNRIVHGYEGFNMQIVWDTVQNDLPGLKDELARIIRAAE